MTLEGVSQMFSLLDLRLHYLLFYCLNMMNVLLYTQNSEVRLQFQEFLSLNGHHLEQRPFPDVVQLALSQPTHSEVYRQALMQAQQRASRGQLYLDWVYVIVLTVRTSSTFSVAEIVNLAASVSAFQEQE